ncbi:hypothetical protein CVIRNUC_005014 [Coccomyxa viridis]|uniref:Uncharacterized protein n=1 Tax=Coccomyxa viridis TaxID=1274662 RepID=A0AAV1I4V6_9CHLO|nr:hypothetical protein CVIRNUC_005014 [Coccomyxa viridis]
MSHGSPYRPGAQPKGGPGVSDGSPQRLAAQLRRGARGAEGRQQGLLQRYVLPLTPARLLQEWGAGGDMYAADKVR